MEKEFITYEQAVKLKELGLDEKCFCYFDNDKELRTCIGLNNWNNHSGFPYFVSSPLKQQVFRWFREKHKIHGSYGTTSDYREEVNGYCISNFIDGNRNSLHINWEVGTYEEAESACIDKLIEIVKNK